MRIKLSALWLGMILIICYSLPSNVFQNNDYTIQTSGKTLMENLLSKKGGSTFSLVVSNEPTIKDNAAHFIYYQDDPHVIHWREWWYMNLETVRGDRLVIMFLTAGDLTKSHKSIAAVIMAFMQEDGSVFWTISPYPSSMYTPDYEKCNVTIDDNWFMISDKDTYQVHYRNPLHSLTLDVTLTKSRQGIKHGNCVTSLGDWEVMGWCIPVSYGNVTGELCFKDSQGSHQYNLIGNGYHDHNWGLIRWNKLGWDWGALSTTAFPFSIIYGQTSYDNIYEGNINIVNETINYSISYPEFKIEHLEWVTIGRYIRPSKIWLHGQSPNCSLNITLDLKFPYIIGIKNMGYPYLLGTGHGSITLRDKTYVFSNILGFYEFHTPIMQGLE